MRKHMLVACLLAAPLLAIAANPAATRGSPHTAAQAKRLTEADRKVTAGRILLKWGGYVEKVNGQDRRAWAASLWPSLAGADLDNLQRALGATTYEGMRNALLGQRPYDEQILDRMARLPKNSSLEPKALGNLAADLVFTPITPCRIIDSRVSGVRIPAHATRDLDASNESGNFAAQGGSDTDCGIPANPAALALSVTGLGNLSTGYLRIYPHDGTNAQGSPVPLNSVNTTATNDMIVSACQGCTQELKVFSTANTHYAVFVTGYFMAPQATQLSCYYEQSYLNVAAAGNETVSVSCGTGYTNTGGGGFWYGTTNDGPIYAYPHTNSSTFSVRGYNTSAATKSLYARARCCRVPGR